MQNGICPVLGCVEPLKRGGYCYAHYMKNWRYGTPTPNHRPRWKDIRGQRFGTLVVIERVDGFWRCRCDCGGQRLARAGDLNRDGASVTCGVPGRHLRGDVTYFTAHERVKRARGAAATRRCADCGGAASQWSYDHDDPDELVAGDVSAHPVAYSVDPSRYSPRCVRCHKAYDLGRINSANR